MAIESRSRSRLPSPGPFLAEITNHLDPSYMGGLEVVLTQGVSNFSKEQSGTYIVRYLNPFYGVTSIRFEGNNPTKFDDVQKSYGMWMIPPDVGTTVMVIFIDGDPNQGYWMGCVQDLFQNHMVPGIAASTNVALSAADIKKYGTQFLPVAEYNKRTNKGSNPDPNKIAKPVHPFAEVLLKQGLLTDPVRGVTSSSARREVPSGVFGFSTPGPVDKTGPKGTIGYSGARRVPVSRLGGSSFVMDDGDINGDNELIRLRTRTGHQILMHNTKDLIYIANAKGSAWIELTGNGKIDIYAKDSVSIHTEADFNFKAERDINLEAGRTVNISAASSMNLNATDGFTLVCNKDGILTFGGSAHLFASADVKIKSGGSSNVSSGDALNLMSGDGMNLKASGSILQTGSAIHINGPAAASASSPATAEKLPLYTLPNTSESVGWENKQYYKTDNMLSIMKRVPTHEPYAQHEALDPELYSEDATDLDNANDKQFTSLPAVTYSRPPDIKGTPPAPSGKESDDNIAAFLWMIRVCEGTSGPNGYRTMFTGKLFDVTTPASPTYNYKDHPRIANKGGGLVSTAAGAYQFLSSTWDECRKQLSLPDFSPASQDKAGILLLKRRKALEDVKAGRFTDAIAKTNKEWASLPGSPYNQNPKPMNVALSYYKQAGGTVSA